MSTTLAIFVTICIASAFGVTEPEAQAQPQAQAQQQEPAATPFTSVNDTKSFKLLVDTNQDALVVFTTNDTLTAEIQTTLNTLATKLPEVTLVHVVCSTTTRRICKHVSSEAQTGALASEVVLAHYRSGRFNRVIKHSDEQSLLAFFANPFSNPCDDDPLVSNYTCVNSLPTFSELLSGTGKLAVLFYAAWNKQINETKTIYSSIAIAHADKAKFVAVDVTLPETGSIAQALDVLLLPAIVIIDLPVSTTCNVRYYPGNVTNATEVAEWFVAAETPATVQCDFNSLVSASTTASLPSTITSTITVVNQTNYDTTINQTLTPTLMLVYSSVCRDCATIIAEFEKAQPLVQAEALNASFLIFNADQSLELVRRWKITSYPTLEYFSNGQFEYIVQRELFKTAQDIVNFFRVGELDRRGFRKLWVKPFVFSSSLKRVNATEATTQIAAAEHTFVMPVFNTTTVEQEVQLRKAVKELSKAIDQLALSNLSASVNFVLVNCTQEAAAEYCAAPSTTKNTTAAFTVSYYHNGTLAQQATAEELVEQLATDAANVTKHRIIKVKSRDFLRWASNVTGLALGEEAEHKQKENAEKATKKARKEKVVDPIGKTAEKKEPSVNADKTKKTKKEEKGKKTEKTEL